MKVFQGEIVEVNQKDLIQDGGISFYMKFCLDHSQLSNCFFFFRINLNLSFKIFLIMQWDYNSTLKNLNSNGKISSVPSFILFLVTSTSKHFIFLLVAVRDYHYIGKILTIMLIFYYLVRKEPL